MARDCLFCGAPARSKEHLFPSWLNRTLDKVPIAADQAGAPLWARGVVDFVSGDQTHNVWGANEIASLTTRKVCAPCNNGWMARLEGRVQPLVIPMILGTPHSLTPNEQVTAATWATKTAIVCESAISENMTWPQDQRETVMRQDQPPGHLRIRAAAIEGLIPPLQFALTRCQVSDTATGVSFDAHIYTLQINTFMMQIVRPDPVPPTFGALKTSPAARDHDVPIFPPMTEFFWPPKISLTPETFGRYTAALAIPTT